MMKTQILSLKTAYAAALIAAAASGSILAAATTAKAAVPAIAATSSGVTLKSKAMIERIETAPDGSERTILKSPGDVIVTPGDRVVFTLSYVNGGNEAASGFRATNPMPGPIQFVEVAEEWALVSVDGGKNFGRLTELTVTEREEVDAVYDDETGAKLSDASVRVETRAATPADVTHVRWAFARPIAPGEKGSVSYRGVVK